MKAVFLDRDGVINKKQPEGRYVTAPSELEMLDGTVEAIRLLNEAGYLVVVVTNQRGIARGLMTVQDLDRVHDKLLAVLAQNGARVDAIYYCPHESGTCSCRKPEVGLFLRAMQDFSSIRLEESFVIGDSRTDMEAAVNVGCRGILLQNAQIEVDLSDLPECVMAASLYEAVSERLLWR